MHACTHARTAHTYTLEQVASYVTPRLGADLRKRRGDDLVMFVYISELSQSGGSFDSLYEKGDQN